MTLRSLFPSVRVLLAALSLAAGLIAYTGQAHASRTQESIFQDDRLLQNPDPQLQNVTLDELFPETVPANEGLVALGVLAGAGPVAG